MATICARSLFRVLAAVHIFLSLPRFLPVGFQILRPLKVPSKNQINYRRVYLRGAHRPDRALLLVKPFRGWLRRTSPLLCTEPNTAAQGSRVSAPSLRRDKREHFTSSPGSPPVVTIWRQHMACSTGLHAVTAGQE